MKETLAWHALPTWAKILLVPALVGAVIYMAAIVVLMINGIVVAIKEA